MKILIKKKFLLYFFTIVLILPLFPVTASADMGPKPFVSIHFNGLEEENYYVTLLSEQASTGPWSTEYEFSRGSIDESEQEIWEKFADYSDIDGFYFLGYLEKCQGNDTFLWSYYPPETFKIIIYFPEYDQWIASKQICKRYAFHSYFEVTVADSTIQSIAQDITADGQVSENIRIKKDYDFLGEIPPLLCRIVLTIVIELIIARPFGYGGKKQIRIIGKTNLITQILLNILLHYINYKEGPIAFYLHYIWLEFLVFLIEAWIYQKLLYRSDSGHRNHPRLYALTANTASFVLGILISLWIPDIF